MLLIGTVATAQPQPAQTHVGDEPPVTMTKSRQFDLRSRNGRTYRIFLAEPVRPAPAEGCPVVYVLDGNAMFATVAESARFQKNLTPALVVGIGYPTEALFDPDRRYWEYTPVTPPEKLNQSPNEPQVKPNGTGGQDQFLAFIEDELKPAVAARVKVDPKRQTLLGHSLAARFVLHALFTKPSAFQTYLALSPSIWWGEGSVLEEENAFAATVRTGATPPINVFLGVGEFEQRLAPNTPPERAAFLTRARMVDNAREMADRLRSVGSGSLAIEFKEYAGENHGSVLAGAISRGLNIALRPTTLSGGSPPPSTPVK